MGSWIVIRTKGSRERYAAENVQRLGYNHYLPVHETRRGKGRLTYTVLVPIFPSYLFVEIENQWRNLLSAFGCAAIVMRGDAPASMTSNAMAALRRLEQNGIIVLPQFSHGDLVRINSGPWENHLGIYQGQTPKERVEILLEVLGGKRSVILPKQLIEAV